jgi:putative SOS response-associated peptidase YedK
MCNRARMMNEPETLWGPAAQLFTERPRDNRFDPRELRPGSRNYVIREQDGERGWDVMTWDVLGGQASWKMTNVRTQTLPQWCTLASRPANRCIIPLTGFCEFTPEKHDLGDGKPPLKGEMWFQVTDRPVFPVAGFWQRTKDGNGFTMVTCAPNSLVEPIQQMTSPITRRFSMSFKDCGSRGASSRAAVVTVRWPSLSRRLSRRVPIASYRTMQLSNGRGTSVRKRSRTVKPSNCLRESAAIRLCQ